MQEPRELAKSLSAKSGPEISVRISNRGGYIAIYWHNDGAVGRYDYVALFDKEPKDANDYLRNQWCYVSNHTSPYVTGTSAQGDSGPHYWVAYCGWDYKASAYEIVVVSGPTQP